MAERPCWEINPRFPKFCAALSNGRKRCRKGHCFLTDLTLFNGPQKPLHAPHMEPTESVVVEQEPVARLTAPDGSNVTHG